MKYSTKVVKEIAGYIEEGLSKKDAALLAGISESTFYEWWNAKPEFLESVTLAVTKYKRQLVNMLRIQAAQNGKLALEVLARRWPEEWGERSLSPATMRPDDYSETTNVSEDAIEELTQFLENIRKARGLPESNKETKPVSPIKTAS